MSSVLMDILKDQVDELVRTAAAETTLSTTRDHVSSLMRNAGMDAGQAMDALGVPEAMRAEVATLVEDGGD